jgi:hypothetical protein
MRYADGVIDMSGSNLYCVCEDNTLFEVKLRAEPINSLICINLKSSSDPSKPIGSHTTVAKGRDFYSNPRLSPDEKQLCFLAWDHPSLPWLGTSPYQLTLLIGHPHLFDYLFGICALIILVSGGVTLYVVDINANGTFSEPKVITGGKNDSVSQPEWSPDGMQSHRSTSVTLCRIFCCMTILCPLKQVHYSLYRIVPTGGISIVGKQVSSNVFINVKLNLLFHAGYSLFPAMFRNSTLLL